MLIAPSQEIGGEIGDKNSNVFRPSWVFETGDSVFYTVDCLDGTVSER